MECVKALVEYQGYWIHLGPVACNAGFRGVWSMQRQEGRSVTQSDSVSTLLVEGRVVQMTSVDDLRAANHMAIATIR